MATMLRTCDGQRRTLWRSAPAVVVAFFVLLQNFAFLTGETAHTPAPAGDPLSLTAAVAVACSAIDLSDDSAPAHPADHSHPCAICGGCPSDLPIAAEGRPHVLPMALSPATPARAQPMRAGAEPPLGWRSSWSAQSPPFFFV